MHIRNTESFKALVFTTGVPKNNYLCINHWRDQFSATCLQNILAFVRRVPLIVPNEVFRPIRDMDGSNTSNGMGEVGSPAFVVCMFEREVCADFFLVRTFTTTTGPPFFIPGETVPVFFTNICWQ